MVVCIWGSSVRSHARIYWHCYPKNWVHLLVAVKPKDTTKPKIRRRRDLLLLAAGKEITGDPSQSSVSLNSKIVDVLS